MGKEKKFKLGFTGVSIELGKSRAAIAKALRADGLRQFSIKKCEKHPVFDRDLPRGVKRFRVTFPLEQPLGRKGRRVSAL